ncbi:hypothetical protein KW817_24435, partial [Enterobacter quasiroggenkampii]|uniref:hypothetical protein n=1 Tax=Enterobacter quasiroggenkampii TaxID=2497436 RepID=UPI0021D16499
MAKALADISSPGTIAGIFAIFTARHTSGASSVTTLIEITPTAFEEIDVFGVPYYEFRFGPGTVVFPNRNLQVLSAPIYNIASYI